MDRGRELSYEQSTMAEHIGTHSWGDVEQGLNALFPANNASLLWEPSAEVEPPPCHALYVQGRIDRLHAVLAASPTDADFEVTTDAFAETPANWRWLVVSDLDWNSRRAAILGRAESGGLGVLVVGPDGMTRARPAQPSPGIFRKRYPALRKEWKTLSNW